VNTRQTVALIGIIGFVTALVGVFNLPSPYSGWAGRFLLIWVAGSVAYTLARTSSKCFPDLVISILVTCVIIAAFIFVTYGKASVTDDGEVISENFPTTFDSRSGAAVRVFIVLFVGAVVGGRIGIAMRKIDSST
jgi:hypothetical protein